MLRHGCGYALANAGHEMRYTELAPDRVKDFWR
jgi:hypothetical protein